MKNAIIASVILGISIVFSSLVISDNISFKDEHIISLSGGAIKLGDIYKEKKLVSAKLYFKEGEQVLISEGNPDEFSIELNEKLQSLLKELNSGKSKNEDKLTLENLSVIDDARLEIVSAVRYTTEYQPMFTLTLETKEIPMEKGSNINSFVTEKLKAFIESQQQAYTRSLYLQK